MLKAKMIFNLCSIIIVVLTLFSLGNQPAYATYANFTFDMPEDSPWYGFPLPLVFVENGVEMSASANSIYWRQTDTFVFTGLSGGVLTNGLRLGLYPSETLTLQFSTGLTQFSSEFSIESIIMNPSYLSLLAFSGTIVVGSIDIIGVDSGSIVVISPNPFDRIELSSGEGMDFAIDNVQVNTVPEPGSIFLLLTGIFGILAVRKNRFGGVRGSPSVRSRDKWG
jgi:hypothetical protein